jgi:hypothetical protein
MKSFASYGETSGFSVMGREDLEQANGGSVTVTVLGVAVAASPIAAVVIGVGLLAACAAMAVISISNK